MLPPRLIQHVESDILIGKPRTIILDQDRERRAALTHHQPHLRTRRLHRVLGEVADMVTGAPQGLLPRPQQRVAQIYRETGNLRAIQRLPGHTKMD